MFSHLTRRQAYVASWSCTAARGLFLDMLQQRQAHLVQPAQGQGRLRPGEAAAPDNPLQQQHEQQPQRELAPWWPFSPAVVVACSAQDRLLEVDLQVGGRGGARFGERVWGGL